VDTSIVFTLATVGIIFIIALAKRPEEGGEE
jgi:hypothetical protein